MSTSPIVTSPDVVMQQKRGPSTHLPTSAPAGQLIVTTDTNELYVGTGTGRVKIGGTSSAHVTNRVLYDDNYLVYADGMKGSLDPKGREGWYFTNSVVGSKINWYYYDTTILNTTVANFQGTYAVVTIDTNRVPYFAVYTGGTLNTWYQSKRVYSVQNPASVAPGKYLIYTGTNPTVYPELQRIQLTADLTNTTLNNGPFTDTEVIAYVTLQTDSGLTPAGSYKFVTHNLGLQTVAENVDLQLKTKGDVALTVPVTVATNTWTINHNLYKRPSVTVVDTAGNTMFADVQHVNDVQVKVLFSTPMTGSVYLN
jgi:hypothetical protein